MMRDKIIEKVVEKLKELKSHIFSRLTQDNIKKEANYTKHIFFKLY